MVGRSILYIGNSIQRDLPVHTTFQTFPQNLIRYDLVLPKLNGYFFWQVVHSKSVQLRGAQRFQWLKPAQKKFTYFDFTNFSKSISADLHHFRFWIFKTCQTVSISRIFSCNLWWFFVIWNLCVVLHMLWSDYMKMFFSKTEKCLRKCKWHGRKPDI